MKKIVWAIVILIIALGIMAEERYTLVINSPIVAKIDRITGNVWIANSGTWRKVQHCSKEECTPQGAAAVKAADKTKQEKAK